MSKVKVRYFSYKSMQELQKEVNEFLERSDIQVEDEQFYPSLHVAVKQTKPAERTAKN